MKISNEKILNSIPVLNKISNMDLPIKTCFTISKNINKINEIVKVYNTYRDKLIDKHCEKKDGEPVIEGNSIKLKQEEVEDFNSELKELLDIENELDITKIKIDDLNNISLSVLEFNSIRYLIEEE